MTQRNWHVRKKLYTVRERKIKVLANYDPVHKENLVTITEFYNAYEYLRFASSKPYIRHIPTFPHPTIVSRYQRLD